MLVDDDPLRVHEESLRGAIDAPVDRNTAATIDRDRLVRVAELHEPAARLGIVILPVKTDDRHDPGTVHIEQRLVLLAALTAPGSPDIEQVPVSLEVR